MPDGHGHGASLANRLRVHAFAAGNLRETRVAQPAYSSAHRRADTVHPIHGMLGAYPLALFTGALVTDIAYAETAQMQWANFSVWMIAGGVIMGVLAAIAGIVDALVSRHKRRAANRLHSVLTIVTFVFAIINGFVHSRDAWTSVVPTGLILSAITAVLVLITSWQGYSVGPSREGNR
jgi:uncharacterized membrane protein